MRKRGLALALAALAPLSACVQMKQYADVQFTPPQGDYKLLVLRPDVTVGSITTGGMVEPRADWIDQARTSITDAIRNQQGTHGGKVPPNCSSTGRSCAAVWRTTSAERPGSMPWSLL